MTVKKQKSKKITPSKLIKTNGKFSWKKGVLLASSLAIVGGVLVYTTFAGSYVSINFTNYKSQSWNWFSNPALGYGGYGNEFWVASPAETYNYTYWWHVNHTTVVDSPSGQNVNWCITYRTIDRNGNPINGVSFKMDIADINQVKYFATPIQKYGSTTWTKTCVQGHAPQGRYSTVQYRIFDKKGVGGITINDFSVKWF